jgi:hypothetical protein
MQLIHQLGEQSSPACVQRVANVFIDDGNGVRGNARQFGVGQFSKLTQYQESQSP